MPPNNIIPILLTSLTDLGSVHHYAKTISITNTSLQIGTATINLKKYKAYTLIGLGKAAIRQVEVTHQFMTQQCSLPFSTGIIITKKKHTRSLDFPMTILEADHPISSKTSLEATDKLCNFLTQLPATTLPIFLLSGGASALLCLPNPPFTLKEQQLLTQHLLQNGADIQVLNLFRQELSAIKNGGLLKYINAKDLITLAISDIPFSNPSFIGSGPTLYHNTININFTKLTNQWLSSKNPNLAELRKKILKFTHSSQRQKFHTKLRQIAKQKNHLFTIINDYHSYAEILIDKLLPTLPIYYNSIPAHSPLKQGITECIKVVKQHIHSPIIYLAGGELPVKVVGNGQGGRNSAFVVGMADKLFRENILQLNSQQLHSISIYSLATDGSDGPTEYAGGFITYERYLNGVQRQLDIEKFITNSDTLSYLQQLNCAFRTGPTGTNIMDIRLITIKPSELAGDYF